jgi:hypothetical protein
VGHTRLGLLPKTQKWKDLVEQVTGTRIVGEFGSAALYVEELAAQTLDASEKGLAHAAHDSGVLYAFYLLTQIAQASRSSNWEAALAQHDIHLTDDSTIFDLTVEVQAAVDDHLRKTRTGTTDLSEMAQQSVGEALMSLGRAETGNLFGGGAGADLRKAIRSLSTKKGFGELGQRFFGRFISRFLSFYLSRATAAAVGGPRLRDLGDISEFNEALQHHCEQSARIVRDFCGDWYSKTAYQEGIDLGNTARFLAVAVKKLRSELAQQRSES